MKKLLLCFAIAIFMLPIASIAQCGTSGLTVSDGTNTYQSIPIGPHCWTTSNLRSTAYSDGTEVPNSLIYHSDMYADEAANLSNYGRLYNWYAAMHVAEGTTTPVVAGEHGFVQGLCPDGWHLPTQAEADELYGNDAPTLHSENPNLWLIPGTNTTGFCMVPGGIYHGDYGRFEKLRGESYIWSATSLDPTQPEAIWSNCYCGYILIQNAMASNAMSVRCIYNIYKPQVSTDSWSYEFADGNYHFYYNGNVTFAGYDEDFIQGFQYGTDPTDLNNDWNEAATEEGAFSLEMEGLQPGVTYYYRAYVINDFGTVYGVINSFTAPTLPTVTTTSPVADITSSSATANGTVTGEYVLTSGICWNTTGTPTVEDSKTTDGPEGTALTNANITATLSDLPVATTYYVRAYATNALGTSYGEVVSFTTLSELPTVTTDSANTVTSNSATLFGNLTDNGGNTSVNVGFKYGLGEDALNNKVSNTASSTGSYNINVADLAANTTYYYKAYATTGTADTVYGEVKSFTTEEPTTTFTCGTSTVSDVDGNIYNTVKIGDQCWTKENLRTSTNTAGTGNIYTPTTSDVPGYDVNTYGRLYDWDAVMQGSSSSEANPSGVQGICPTGWHVPSDAEWTQLTDYVSSQSDYLCDPGDNTTIAKALASTTGWNSDNGTCSVGNNQDANNATGFSAVPAGNHSSIDGGYFYFGTMSTFWSATEHSVLNLNSWHWNLSYSGSNVSNDFHSKGYSRSVRCVKDAEPAATFTCGTSTVKDVDNNEYNTVKIGDQCWTKENLRTSTTTGNTYHANNNASNDETYGLLYDWAAVMQGATSSTTNPSGVQGICPTGWHVPSSVEWTQLTDYVTSQSEYLCDPIPTIVWALASPTGWNSTTVPCSPGNNPSVNNATGFSVVPAGLYNESCIDFGYSAFLWAASQTDIGMAYSLYMGYSNPTVSTFSADMNRGYSVRCLRDAADGSELGENESNGTLEEPVAEMSVTTDSANMVTNTTVTLYGNLTDNGGNTSVNVGFKYGLSEDALNNKVGNTASSTGSYNINVADLAANTTYYYKAYATTGTADTVYGEVKSFTTEEPTTTFTCGTSTVSDVDGNIYNTIKIGDQCWTKENLKTTKYADGTAIALGGVSSTAPCRYYPDGDASNVETFGYLYNWAAAMNGASSSNAVPSGVQGICPKGWHIPSNAEWYQLSDFVSSISDYVCGDNPEYIAKSLAAATEWGTWTGFDCLVGGDLPSNNATGFTILPAGHFDAGGEYYSYFRRNTGFWSSTLKNSDEAYNAYFFYGSAQFNHYESNIRNGSSVRCLRDQVSPAPAPVFECGTSTISDVDGNTYNTVKIGDQCWMKENLRTTKKPNGDAIVDGIYAPNGDNNNVATYGRLYTWETMMNGASSSSAVPSGVQGICPTGWHVPSNAEWTQLTNYVSSQSEYVCGGNSEYIAKALASTTGWKSSTGAGWDSNTGACVIGNTPEANNTTGFSAVPAGHYSNGYGYYNVGYNEFGDDAYFWSATQNTADFVYYRDLYYNNPAVFDYFQFREFGFSVRCVKDAEPEPETAEMSVTTDSANTVTSTAATLYGNVTDLGGNASVNAGFKYGTSETAMNTKADDAVFATGLYSINITGLTANTTYYYTAYTATTTDTVYGDTLRFRTLSINPCLGVPTIKDVDNNTYNTVQIGGQCWTAQNLRTTTINGYGNVYTNPAADVDTYGRYYDWAAVMQGATSTNYPTSGDKVQGICPTGWHVPSVAEWTQLINNVKGVTDYRCNGTSNNIAKSLASTTGWNNNETTCAVGNTPSNNNATGFTAVPAGYYSSDFNSFGDLTVFWAATQFDSDRARTVSLKSNQASELNNSRYGVHGCSVRCLKN